MAYGEEYTEDDTSIIPDDIDLLGGLDDDPEIQALIGRAAGELELNLVDGPLLPDEKENVPTNFAGYAALKMDKLKGLGLEDSYRTGVEGAKEGDIAAGAKADLIESGAAEEPQTRSQAIAQALIGITPILIGMAMKGKKGAAIGAQAGSVGVGMIEKQRLEDEKRFKDERHELGKLGVQQKGQNQRAILSQVMQNAMANKAFSRQKELIDYRNQFKETDIPDQGSIDALLAMEREAGLPSRPPPVDGKDYNRRFQIAAESRRGLDVMSERFDKEVKMEQLLPVGLYPVEGKVPTPEAAKKSSNLEAYRRQLDTQLNYLENSIKENDFVAMTEKLDEGKALAAQDQQSAIANIIKLVKTAEGDGANFTGLEFGNVAARLGGSKYVEFVNEGLYDQAKKLLARAVTADQIQRGIQNLRRDTAIATAVGHMTNGYYAPGVNYKALQQIAPASFPEGDIKRIPMDSEGRASESQWFHEKFGIGATARRMGRGAESREVPGDVQELVARWVMQDPRRDGTMVSYKEGKLVLEAPDGRIFPITEQWLQQNKKLMPQ